MQKLGTRLFLVLTALALLAAPVAAQDWAGKGRAQGIVKDERGKPVEGAKVTLIAADTNSGPEPVYTNKKGRWSFLGLRGGMWRVLIDAEGFMPSEGSYGVNEFGASPPAQIELTRNPNFSIDKGDSLLEAGEYAAARAEYEKALADLEAVPAARLRSRIGDTYYEEGEFEAARAEYAKALPHIQPEEQAHIRLQLANSYQRQSNYAEARKEFENVLPLLGTEGQAQVLLTMARGYDMEDNRDEAIKTLERALEIDPDNTEILQLTADLLTRAGREEEAEAYLARMPEDMQLPADMILNMGISAYNDGEMEKARGFFDRAVQENPDMAETYYYRGLVHLSAGNNDEAKSDFQRLLQLEPENPHAEEVKEFLSFLESGS